MRKKLLSLAMAPLMLAGLVANAHAEFYGSWGFTRPNDWQNSTLQLRGGGAYLNLVGTTERCIRRGNSYSHMRSVMMNSNRYSNGLVSWWVDADCGSYVRVCISNDVGDSGCSTYERRSGNV